MKKLPKHEEPATAFGIQEAADALNEQGFLFQQVIGEEIQNGRKGQQQQWQILANEYPVTATDGSQTRIDLLLNHIRMKNVYICLECKRPNPIYKTWLFFGRNMPRLFIEDGGMETGRSYDTSKPIDYKQGISSQFQVTSIPIFNFYLEATKRKPGSDKSSNNETIEKALRQLIAGHSGMMNKLRSYEKTDGMSFYRSIPVIVTTANLFEAEFDCKNISLNNGMIESSLLKLVPQKFCAINYHPDDSLSIPRQHSNYIRSDVLTDMNFYQTRTVFIVYSSAINDFLFWAGEHLTKHP
jgi:hypothetical protein